MSTISNQPKVRSHNANSSLASSNIAPGPILCTAQFDQLSLLEQKAALKRERARISQTKISYTLRYNEPMARITMYKHMIYALFKDANVHIEGENCYFLKQHYAQVILKNMHAYTSSFVNTPSASWAAFKERYPAIRLASGLEALFHFSIYLSTDLLELLKDTAYELIYYCELPALDAELEAPLSTRNLEFILNPGESMLLIADEMDASLAPAESDSSCNSNGEELDALSDEATFDVAAYGIDANLSLDASELIHIEKCAEETNAIETDSTQALPLSAAKSPASDIIVISDDDDDNANDSPRIKRKKFCLSSYTQTKHASSSESSTIAAHKPKIKQNGWLKYRFSNPYISSDEDDN